MFFGERIFIYQLDSIDDIILKWSKSSVGICPCVGERGSSSLMSFSDSGCYIDVFPVMLGLCTIDVSSC